MHIILFGEARPRKLAEDIWPTSWHHTIPYIVNDGNPTYLRGASYTCFLGLAFAYFEILSQVTRFTNIQKRRSDPIPTCINVSGMRCKQCPIRKLFCNW